MAASPGDFTGKQKEALAKQHAEEQQKRANEMSMITAAQEVKKTREVVDYTKPKAAPAPDPGPIDLTEEDEENDDQDGEGDALIDAIVASASAEDAGPPAEEGARERHPAAVREQQPVRVEKSSSLIRARYDLPQVTVGHGNTYDFEEGRQYKVPPNVAQHLSERQLVDILH